MASSFNLTAELNLRGPSNLNQVVGNIRKQLSTVSLDLKIDPRASSNIQGITSNINNLSRALRDAESNAASLNSTLRTLGAGIGSASTNIGNLGNNLNNANNAINNVRTRTAEATSEIEAFGRQAGLAVRRFAAFSLVTGSIYAIAKAFGSAYSEFLNFNKEFIRLQQVTAETATGLKGLSQEIVRLSQGLGVTSQSLLQVSVTLSQAGLSAAETKTALEALAKSSLAPSFDDMNSTVEGSIALMKQFGISANDLESALGSINAVAAKFAVEAGDIITAIQRTGGVFASASQGVSQGKDALNEFIAVFTSVRATTRESAETIATGLRTIFSRIQRGGTIEALKQYGVELTDVQGKFVGAYEAVRRLSDGLSKLDTRDIRFSAIIEELGGFRQVGKVIPLIQQFATAQDALNVAQRGAGSLAKDVATAQEGLGVKITKVREQFVSLVRDVGQSKGFQTFVDISLKLASALISIADAAKSVLPALTAIVAVKGISNIGSFVTGLSSSLGGGGGGRRRFARGGLVPGSGSGDTVPAMLTPGEFVIRKKAVETIGINNLHRMNKYAGGGPVSPQKLYSMRMKKYVEENLDNIDTINFNKTVYGVQSSKNVQAKTFEELVKNKLGRGTHKGGNYPVDIVDTGQGPVEVRNRVERTPDYVLADKLMRYYLESGQNNYINRFTKKKNQKADSIQLGNIGIAYNLAKYIPSEKYNKLAGGGIIQKFLEGGGVKDIATSQGKNIEDVILGFVKKLGGIGGVKQYLGIAKNDRQLDSLFRKGNIGRNIGKASSLIDQARQAAENKGVLRANAISAAQQLAIVGFDPVGYSSTLLEKLSNTNSAINIRGILPEYSQEAQGILDSVGNAVTSGARKLQSKAIFGGKKNLVFDFDDTLVSGADIYKPGTNEIDIAGYSDLNKVKQSLNGRNVRLTELGQALKSILQSSPDILDQIRILTARPQSNAPLLASKLQDLGLNIPVGKITGVSGSRNKPQNLGSNEKLIDDLYATVAAVRKGGGEAFPYSPIKTLSGKEQYAANLAAAEGSVIQAVLVALGASGGSIQNEDVDFKSGLGPQAASFFGVAPNIPTEVKRTLSSDSIYKAKQEFTKWFQSNGMASGGSVEDTVPAMLTPGEFVINKKAAQRIGYHKLNKLNKADKIRGYNKGGSVGFVQSYAVGGGPSIFDSLTSSINKVIQSFKQLTDTNTLQRARQLKAQGYDRAERRDIIGQEKAAKAAVLNPTSLLLGAGVAGDLLSRAGAPALGAFAAGGASGAGVAKTVVDSLSFLPPQLKFFAVSLTAAAGATSAYLASLREIRITSAQKSIETSSNNLNQAFERLSKTTNVTSDSFGEIKATIEALRNAGQTISQAKTEEFVPTASTEGLVYSAIGTVLEAAMLNLVDTGIGKMDKRKELSYSKELESAARPAVEATQKAMSEALKRGLTFDRARTAVGATDRDIAIARGGSTITDLEARLAAVQSDRTLPETVRNKKEAEIKQAIALTTSRLVESYRAETTAKQENIAITRQLIESSNQYSQSLQNTVASVQRGSSEFSQYVEDINAAVGTKGGGQFQPSANKIDTEIFKNLRAYSQAEVSSAIDNLASRLNFSPEFTQQTKERVSVKQNLEKGIQNIFGSLAAKPGGDVTGEFDKAIKGLLAPLKLSETSLLPIIEGLRKEFDNLSGSGADVTLSELSKNNPGLQKFFDTVGISSAQLEEMANVANQVSAGVRNFGSKLTESLVLAKEYSNAAVSARTEGALRLSQTLNQPVGLNQLNQSFNNTIRSLTGVTFAGDNRGGRQMFESYAGTTDVATIEARLRKTEEEQKTLKNKNRTPQEEVRFAQVNAQAINLEKALKQLATDSSRASNALSKIEEVQKAKQGRTDVLMDLLSNVNNPEYMTDFIMNQQKFSNIMAGQGNAFDIPGAIQALQIKMRGQTPDDALRTREDFLQGIYNIARREANNPQQAEAMIAGVKSVLEAPEYNVSGFIKEYNDAITALAKANEALASRGTEAAGMFETAIRSSANYFADKVRGAADNTTITGSATATTKAANGGLIYAARGKYVNFQPKGTDTVPAMLTPGEFVVNAKATKKNLSLLKAINNNGKAAGYSKGGMVYLQGGGLVEAKKKLDEIDAQIAEYDAQTDRYIEEWKNSVIEDPNDALALAREKEGIDKITSDREQSAERTELRNRRDQASEAKNYEEEKSDLNTLNNTDINERIKDIPKLEGESDANYQARAKLQLKEEDNSLKKSIEEYEQKQKNATQNAILQEQQRREATALAEQQRLNSRTPQQRLEDERRARKEAVEQQRAARVAANVARLPEAVRRDVERKRAEEQRALANKAMGLSGSGTDSAQTLEDAQNWWVRGGFMEYRNANFTSDPKQIIEMYKTSEQYKKDKATLIASKEQSMRDFQRASKPSADYKAELEERREASSKKEAQDREQREQNKKTAAEKSQIDSGRVYFNQMYTSSGTRYSKASAEDILKDLETSGGRPQGYYNLKPEQQAYLDAYIGDYQFKQRSAKNAEFNADKTPKDAKLEEIRKKDAMEAVRLGIIKPEDTRPLTPDESLELTKRKNEERKKLDEEASRERLRKQNEELNAIKQRGASTLAYIQKSEEERKIAENSINPLTGKTYTDATQQKVVEKSLARDYPGKSNDEILKIKREERAASQARDKSKSEALKEKAKQEELDKKEAEQIRLASIQATIARNKEKTKRNRNEPGALGYLMQGIDENYGTGLRSAANAAYGLGEIAVGTTVGAVGAYAGLGSALLGVGSRSLSYRGNLAKGLSGLQPRVSLEEDQTAQGFAETSISNLEASAAGFSTVAKGLERFGSAFTFDRKTMSEVGESALAKMERERAEKLSDKPILDLEISRDKRGGSTRIVAPSLKKIYEGVNYIRDQALQEAALAGAGKVAGTLSKGAPGPAPIVPQSKPPLTAAEAADAARQLSKGTPPVKPPPPVRSSPQVRTGTPSEASIAESVRSSASQQRYIKQLKASEYGPNLKAVAEAGNVHFDSVQQNIYGLTAWKGRLTPKDDASVMAIKEWLDTRGKELGVAQYKANEGGVFTFYSKSGAIKETGAIAQAAEKELMDKIQLGLYDEGDTFIPGTNISGRFDARDLAIDQARSLNEAQLKGATYATGYKTELSNISTTAMEGVSRGGNAGVGGVHDSGYVDYLKQLRVKFKNTQISSSIEEEIGRASQVGDEWFKKNFPDFYANEVARPPAQAAATPKPQGTVLSPPVKPPPPVRSSPQVSVPSPKGFDTETGLPVEITPTGQVRQIEAAKRAAEEANLAQRSVGFPEEAPSVGREAEALGRQYDPAAVNADLRAQMSQFDSELAAGRREELARIAEEYNAAQRRTAEAAAQTPTTSTNPFATMGLGEKAARRAASGRSLFSRLNNSNLLKFGIRAAEVGGISYAGGQLSEEYQNYLDEQENVENIKAIEEYRKRKGALNATTRANGGLIYASRGKLVPYQPRGTDTVPAMLTPGEFVINRKAAKQNMGLLKAINNGQTVTPKRFNKGGIVDTQYYETAGSVGSPTTSGGVSNISVDSSSLDTAFSNFQTHVSSFGGFVGTFNEAASKLGGLSDIASSLSQIDLTTSAGSLNLAAVSIKDASSILQGQIGPFSSSVTELAGVISRIPSTITLTAQGSIPVNGTITVTLEGPGAGSIDETNTENIQKSVFDKIALAINQATAGSLNIVQT